LVVVVVVVVVASITTPLLLSGKEKKYSHYSICTMQLSKLTPMVTHLQCMYKGRALIRLLYFVDRSFTRPSSSCCLMSILLT
jgi:hypothetical protein